MLKRLASACVVAATLAASQLAYAADPENTLIITLKDGDVTIALRPDLAPKHVEQIKALAREGAYDNVAFHRVIDGFMAQTGDVQYGDLNDGYDAMAAGMGSSDKPDLPAEFSDTPFVRGTVGMARAQDPNSANSQFFITFGDAGFLNGQYTVVGEVEGGMELVDNIKKGDQADNGTVTDPDPQMARLIADGVARAYVDANRDSALENANAVVAELLEQVEPIKDKLLSMEQRKLTMARGADFYTPQPQESKMQGRLSLLENQRLADAPALNRAILEI